MLFKLHENSQRAFEDTFKVILLSMYRIYSNERPCSKERLPRMSAPLLIEKI